MWCSRPLGVLLILCPILPVCRSVRTRHSVGVVCIARHCKRSPPLPGATVTEEPRVETSSEESAANHCCILAEVHCCGVDCSHSRTATSEQTLGCVVFFFFFFGCHDVFRRLYAVSQRSEVTPKPSCRYSVAASVSASGREYFHGPMRDGVAAASRRCSRTPFSHSPRTRARVLGGWASSDGTQREDASSSPSDGGSTSTMYARVLLVTQL